MKKQVILPVALSVALAVSLGLNVYQRRSEQQSRQSVQQTDAFRHSSPPFSQKVTNYDYILPSDTDAVNRHFLPQGVDK